MEPTASSASDAHPLPERWSFWFDRFSSDATFEASIQELTSFASVEGFWRTYCHLARPSALGNGDNYHVFRGDRPPAWEAMPNCGTWLHRLDRANPELDALWERLLLAMVGEALGEPCVAGAILSVRKLDATLSVWIADASDAEQNRRVGCRLREALELDDGALTWRSSNAHRRPM